MAPRRIHTGRKRKLDDEKKNKQVPKACGERIVTAKRTLECSGRDNCHQCGSHSAKDKDDTACYMLTTNGGGGWNASVSLW